MSAETTKERTIPETPVKSKKSNVSFVASVKLTIISLSLIAATVLVGAWCPQEGQVGREKVFEAFGEKAAPVLIQLGISDIFHTPWFLFLIALLTLNMVACSFQRVFPKIRLLRQPLPALAGQAILRLPYNRAVALAPTSETEAELSNRLASALKKKGFKVTQAANTSRLTAEYGKVGRLAATVTHIGLLTLVAGVTITSWTGFNGFQPVKLGDSMSFADSQHSKLWVGSLPDWTVRVNKTWKESYPGGEPKQWFSDLSVIDKNGKEQKRGVISVNNPLTYDSVDIYQASWGLDSLELKFNGQPRELPLQSMGRRHAAFLPLDSDSVLIFSASDQSPDSPLRLFAKRTEWEAPKKITEIKPGQSIDMGGVQVQFSRLLPRTGLQYKRDPGLGIIYVAFAFIMAGVMLAAIPFRQVWASVEPGSDSDSGSETNTESDEENADKETDLKTQPHKVLYIGGRSVKARVGFERLMDSLVEEQFTACAETIESPEELKS